MRLRDGPEAAELGVGKVELDPLVARPLLFAVRRRRRGRLGLLDCSLSPVGRNSTLLLLAFLSTELCHIKDECMS